METGGPWKPESSEFIAELGKTISQITLEPFEIISFPKAVHIAAEGELTSIQNHVLSTVIFVPGSVPFQITTNLQFLACRLRAGGR